MLKESGTYLITTDLSFCAPDGVFYRAVWGVCHLHEFYDSDGIEHIKHRGREGVYVTVGDSAKCKIAMCNIHYAFEMDTLPKIIKSKTVNGLEVDNIYIAK